MELTEEQKAIIGADNMQSVGGQILVNAIGMHRLADAVISGRMEGNPEAAREMKKAVNATVQAMSRLN